jgi:hypothetical protein
VAEWKKAHRPDLIMSMTPNQVISKFGSPYTLDRAPDGNVNFMMYKDIRHGIYCSIGFREGKVWIVKFDAQ